VSKQQWLNRRMDVTLPALMRKYGVQMWVIPMREYNEDPLFTSLVAPTTFAARRRTIYVFFDRGPQLGIERLALGGSSQGGVYKALRSNRSVAAPVGGKQAELWGDEQWLVLKEIIEARQPKTIAINISRTFAFADGLSAGEYEGMAEALGPAWSAKFTRAEGLAVDFIATRLPEEEAFYKQLNILTWSVIKEAFSNRVIQPNKTRTSDVEWWMRQRYNDLGLGTWFQPSVDVQRQGQTVEQLGEDPVIQLGDVLHCDMGITALRLNTDTQHMVYVLKKGETDVSAGLKKALTNSNRLQDIVLANIKPGLSGNQILKSAQAQMQQEGIDGTIYTHPIGLHGHGAGPLIGLWDRQEGVPGRGDQLVIPNQWFSVELQATTPVPEWANQNVRSSQEEDIIVGSDGKARWAWQRQTTYHLVK
jgi:Xaa-Pro aminopeptidase